MSSLFLIRDDNPVQSELALAGAEAQFARHGHAPANLVRRTFPGWKLLFASFARGGPEGLSVAGDDFVAVAGTFLFDGKIGRPALVALLAAACDLPSIDWSRVAGQFVALVRWNKRTFVFTDFFGALQLFHDTNNRVFSTSLLSAVEVLPRVSFDAQGVYEWAFNVFPIGDDTPLAEVKRLGPDRIIELTEQGTVSHPTSRPLPEFAAKMPLVDRITLHRDKLMAVVEAHVGHFGSKVNAPLSGGLDSRLLLAALRAAGCTPHSYVYGSKDSEDVRLARQIGFALGFEVEWVNKEGFRTEIEPEAFAEQTLANFHDCDALAGYGDIFDNGGHAWARAKVHEGGALAASGGCGEVFRDFFFLQDRATSARALAQIFYARYYMSDLTDRFDEHAFLTAIEDKVLAALGRTGHRGRLTRGLIEQAYPRVRCRSFFGREISLVARQGAYLMPFLDHNLVAEAMQIPNHLKQAGRFEAALLTAIDPALAALPSAYGHSFDVPPSVHHRFEEWATRVRPMWLRHNSYAIQRRLRLVPDTMHHLLTDKYMSRVIDLEFPAMRQFFNIDTIADPDLWQRIACLEYLAKYLGSRLSA